MEEDRTCPSGWVEIYSHERLEELPHYMSS